MPRTQSRSGKALTFPSESVSVDEEKVAQKQSWETGFSVEKCSFHRTLQGPTDSQSQAAYN